MAYETVLKAKHFDLEIMMADFGPGLITGFDVNKHFENGGLKETDGRGYTRFRGRHHSRGEFVKFDCSDEQDSKGIEMTFRAYMESVESAREYPAPRSSYVDKDASGSRTTSNDGGAKDEESHAMLLIGGRRDSDGNLWMLLQNWWKDMQLVEVSTEYFATCQASLSFLSSPLKFDGSAVDKMEKCYTMNHSLVANCNNLDRAENPNGCFNRGTCDRWAF